MSIQYRRESTLNSSNKSFTVPIGATWKLQLVSVFLTSTAAVGNRQVALRITDGTNTVAEYNAGVVQAASLTNNYLFYPNAPDGTVLDAARYITKPNAGEIVMLPGWVVNVLDTAAIAATADDMTVNLVYNERVVGNV